MAQLDITTTDGVKMVRVRGSLTCEGVEEIHEAFAGEILSNLPLVVNLSEVDVIATPGISMLLAADRNLKQAGRELILTGASPFVQDVLHRSKLDTVWKVIPNPADAVQHASKVR